MTTGVLNRPAEIRKLVNQGATFEGDVKVAELPRFTQALARETGSIHYCLSFLLDEGSTPLIQGTLSGRVQLSCQRCLQAVPVDVSSELSVAVVWAESQLARLPKHLDSIIGEEGVVDLLQLVEDELLLCLPLVSYHEEGSCAEELKYSSPIEPVQPEHDNSAQEPARENPFQALAALKDKL
jgi:uncharacterized protein